MNTKALIAGAISGFVAAALADLDAWRAGTGSFDLKTALKRWIAGALSGALAAVGIGGAL